ncbi:helix-turn-helix transcriptional regulator [Cytophaga hutchinsonii]|uniref:HTH cro/C1-type domain-containing protein n=1 Tax=Cytophaga hutchinsonii (strain ATCC 33406 / DSM 1761 / CIP 103989 / NBRC 15051 / NCIMB 9469 / D465) TaxID=269798 RepID=A0A6N4SRN4_CYTH3|nr:helix-turn-helix transcriptional regulator [Cytophaga hutchinsonii]ABG58975.1 conserved hypothetical protein, possible transcriptional regulator [Cytophaga hutchinsonii ATCC 33406]SFX39682.1 Helix-turn-helix domain-containing protein [Cytophaga hutchinsonii ATCC 33406]
MEESIVERVLVLIKDYGLTASEFADKIDVQRSSMSHLVSGRNKPSLDFIQKILNNFSDINPTWLIMGTGPMKQLDLFDIKGDVAPTEPIPAEKFKSETAVQPVTELITAEQESAFSEPAKVVYAQTAPAPVALPEPPVQHVALEREEVLIQPQITASVPLIPPVTIPESPVIQPAAAAPVTPQIPPPAAAPTPVIPAETAFFTEKSTQNDKKVVKIVFFYSDNTFETFNPQ